MHGVAVLRDERRSRRAEVASVASFVSEVSQVAAFLEVDGGALMIEALKTARQEKKKRDAKHETEEGSVGRCSGLTDAL